MTVVQPWSSKGLEITLHDLGLLSGPGVGPDVAPLSEVGHPRACRTALLDEIAPARPSAPRKGPPLMSDHDVQPAQSKCPTAGRRPVMGPTSASPDTTSGVVPGAVAPGNNPPISNTPARAW